MEKAVFGVTCGNARCLMLNMINSIHMQWNSKSVCIKGDVDEMVSHKTNKW